MFNSSQPITTKRPSLSECERIAAAMASMRLCKADKSNDHDDHEDNDGEEEFDDEEEVDSE
jgi:hypothetical protein